MFALDAIAPARTRGSPCGWMKIAMSKAPGAEIASGGSNPSPPFPFPVEAGPPRRPLLGWVLSIGGTLLVAVSLLGTGLAVNGLVWPFLHMYLSKTKQASPFPAEAWPLLLGFSLLAILVGGFVAIVGASEGMRWRERGRRLRYTSALTLRTGKKPVLLLRSFHDEELLDPRPLDFFQRRYEENLTRTLQALGPVLCIGRPNDRLGFGGAARLYVSDAHWQKAVCHMRGGPSPL